MTQLFTIPDKLGQRGVRVSPTEDNASTTLILTPTLTIFENIILEKSYVDGFANGHV